ncbi:unnamed protein product [Linum trigynum]|uniref:Uncharacterized protein n=1 Tax=Linum trigynum TaxID=586398 RepID=A0AAV2FS31_9ROSI
MKEEEDQSLNAAPFANLIDALYREAFTMRVEEAMVLQGLFIYCEIEDLFPAKCRMNLLSTDFARRGVTQGHSLRGNGHMQNESSSRDHVE